MQGRAGWIPPTGVLGRLCAGAFARASALGVASPEQKRRARELPPPPSLRASLSQGGEVAIIAELKRKSPSKGELDPVLDAAARAVAYALGGALGVSVLTEPVEFGGSLEDLHAVRAAVSLPVLRKDFLVDPAQIWEARMAGASAVLLIVRALGPEGTRRMADVAREAGLEQVVEVRDERELRWALDAGADIIGVNRRNLETLAMEDGVVERVLPLIPAGRIAVSESGVRDRADVEAAARMGADAVLVGSSLTTSPDPVLAVRALTGVSRRTRAT